MSYKVFVRRVPKNATETFVRSAFEEFGEVEDVSIPTDPYTFKPRGFVYVSFKNKESMDAALRKGTCTVMGATVEISTVEIKKKAKQCQRLYIKGLPTDGKEEDLLKFFNSLGKVVLSIFPKDRNTGLLRNFCYLTFESEELTKKLLDEGFIQMGSDRLSVMAAQRRDQLYPDAYEKPKATDKVDELMNPNHEEYDPTSYSAPSTYNYPLPNYPYPPQDAYGYPYDPNYPYPPSYPPAYGYPPQDPQYSYDPNYQYYNYPPESNPAYVTPSNPDSKQPQTDPQYPTDGSYNQADPNKPSSDSTQQQQQQQQPAVDDYGYLQQDATPADPNKPENVNTYPSAADPSKPTENSTYPPPPPQQQQQQPPYQQPPPHSPYQQPSPQPNPYQQPPPPNPYQQPPPPNPYQQPPPHSPYQQPPQPNPYQQPPPGYAPPPNGWDPRDPRDPRGYWNDRDRLNGWDRREPPRSGWDRHDPPYDRREPPRSGWDRRESPYDRREPPRGRRDSYDYDHHHHHRHDRSRSRSRDESGYGNENGEDGTRIFVQGLSPTVTEQIIRDHFSPFGTVTHVSLPINHDTGKQRDIAYITMDNADSVNRILRDASRVIGGTEVKQLCRAKPKPMRR